MADTAPFAAEIVRIILERFQTRAVDLRRLLEADVPFQEWLEAEAYLACRARQSELAFCEVSLHPTYGSEGLPGTEHGSVRVGGSGEPGDHRWLFAEIVFLREAEDEQAITASAIERLLRLKWKRSAALLILASASLTKTFAEPPELSRPLFVDASRIFLPDGGSVAVQVFDIKGNLEDTLCLR